MDAFTAYTLGVLIGFILGFMVISLCKIARGD